MLNYAIVVLVLLSLTIHRYLVSYRDNGLLPYARGFDIFSIILALTHTVAFVWMLGIVAGMIAALLCFFQIVHMTILWIFLTPGLIRVNIEKTMPRVNGVVYGSFSYLVGALIILVIINFFISPYKVVWTSIQKNMVNLAIFGGGLLLFGNLIRIVVLKKLLG